jgi:hypothetical protein
MWLCHGGGVLLHGTHLLPDGTRIRVRLPLAADRGPLRELLASLGLRADELELRRALNCEPGRRAVVVALEWDGTHQRLAGFGAVDVRSGAMTLLGRPAITGALREELRAQSETWRRRVA